MTKSGRKGRKQTNMRKGKTGSQIARQQYRKGNINNERKKEGNIGNKKQKWSHEPGLIPGAVTPCSYLQNVETGTGAQKTAFAISKRGGGVSRVQSDQGFNLTTFHYLVLPLYGFGA